MRKVVFIDAAKADFVSAFSWYEARRPGLGEAFRHEVDAVLSRVSQQPLEFRQISIRCRCAVVRRFPYLLVFESSEQTITLYAVFHTAQDSSTWQRRLPHS